MSNSIDATDITKVNMVSPEVLECPYPYYERVREEALAQAEARVTELESRLHAIDMDLADPTRYTDLPSLSRQRDALAAQLAEAEEACLALYEGA